MKKTIMTAALALVLAAPAAAFSAGTGDYDTPTTTGRTAGSTPPSAMMNDDSTANTVDSADPAGTGNIGTPVDQTIRDLQEAKNDLNGATATKTRTKVMREIEAALKDLKAMQPAGK